MDVLTFLLKMKQRISSLIAMLSAAVQAKGDSKEVFRALRESQASEVASMPLQTCTTQTSKYSGEKLDIS